MKILFILLALACSCVGIAQPFLIKKSSCSLPDRRYGIEYCLPDSVVFILNSKLCINEEKQKGSFFLIFDHNSDTTEIRGFRNKRSNNKESFDVIDILKRYTNRYVVICSKNFLPLIFKSDFDYAFPNISFTGYQFYIKFVGQKFDKGEILEMDFK